MVSVEAALVSVGLVVIILSSGITYGWTALCVVLDREKELYYYLPKAERTSKRELIMTVAMMCVNVGGMC